MSEGQFFSWLLLLAVPACSLLVVAKLLADPLEACGHSLKRIADSLDEIKSL